MRGSRHWIWIVVMLLVVTTTLTACGAQGPEADLDINGRVLEIRPEENWIKINEQDAGRKYDMKTTASTEILRDKDTIRLEDVEVGNQVRIWANNTSGDVKYEILKLVIVDSGEAAPSMR